MSTLEQFGISTIQKFRVAPSEHWLETIVELLEKVPFAKDKWMDTNPTSNEKKAILFDEYKYPVLRRTRTGQPDTTYESLVAMAKYYDTEIIDGKEHQFQAFPIAQFFVTLFDLQQYYKDSLIVEQARDIEAKFFYEIDLNGKHKKPLACAFDYKSVQPYSGNPETLFLIDDRRNDVSYVQEKHSKSVQYFESATGVPWSRCSNIMQISKVLHDIVGYPTRSFSVHGKPTLSHKGMKLMAQQRSSEGNPYFPLVETVLEIIELEKRLKEMK